MSRQRSSSAASILGGLLLLALFPGGILAQAGQITGRVIHGESGEPVAAVQISVQGTTIGGLSASDGTFTLSNVPAGTYTLVVQRLGFQEFQQTGVTVLADQATAVNLTVRPAVLALQGIVATGLVDPVEGVRSPISVGRVDREMMPIPVAGSPVQNLQGRLAGVTIARSSGQPGEGVNIQLRSQTSLTSAGRSTQPLIVVDGVILSSGASDGQAADLMTALESIDIESIEIVRGAAAASLYGSRANAGVVAITTARGSGLSLGETRMSARSEIGWSLEFPSPDFPTHHQFLVDDPVNPTTWVDVNGNPVSRANRVAPPPALAFMDKPYPTPTFNNFNGVFQPGSFQTHSFSVARNSAETNFAVTITNFSESGPLPNNDGYARNSFRVNLDHRFRENVSFGLSAYHARDTRDELQGIGGGTSTSFSALYRVPPDVDLSRKVNGEFVRQPNPDIELENPLWLVGSRESDRNRARTLASWNARWDAASWLSISGLASYDRMDSKSRLWVPKGTPQGFSGDESDGSISFGSTINDTWNGEVQAQLRRDFGDLNVRTTLRGIFERERIESHGSTGTDFFVVGVPTVNSAQNRDASSSQQEVVAQGYLVDNAFSFQDKYIASVLLRRDGSSLFGPDNRWHWYYRAAGAWRIGEEDWFNVRNVDEFKVSFSRGTAGSRPGFSQQYELWSVGSAGVSKTTLGNRDLRPEHSVENEVSLETILYSRIGIELNYAWQETSEQIILLDLPSFTGYTNQWTNGGTLSGQTLELSIEAQVITTPRFAWQTMVVGDRTRGKISDWPFPCTSPAWLQRCDGVNTGSIWGFRFASSLSELTDPIQWPSGTNRPNTCHHGCRAADRASEFMVNDDGLLVWVGEGNDYRDGLSKNLWGTSTQIGGLVYNWGIPFNLLDPNGGIVRTDIGNASHSNIGWINNVSFGALSFHTQFHAKVGGDVVNREMQLATANFASPNQDQAGKPEELKKPILYYTTLQAGASGSTYFVEDGSYLKLRTLSSTYRFTPTQMARFRLGNLGIQTLQVGLIGRDLLTFSSYRGLDPEQGLSPAGQAQTDTAGYPPTRTFTAEISVTF